MPLINCASCDGLRPYRVQPDRLFVCTGCEKRLHVSDIDLDGQEEWMVSEDGLLGYEDQAERFGGDVKPARLSCPKCGSEKVDLKVRQWAACSDCDWGGMEFELTSYENGWT